MQSSANTDISIEKSDISCENNRKECDLGSKKFDTRSFRDRCFTGARSFNPLNNSTMDKKEVCAGLFPLPIVFLALAPLRNAMAIAAVDSTSSMTAIYRKVFSGGLRNIYKGSLGLTTMAFPAGFILGPAYHSFRSITNCSIVSSLMTGFLESVIFYSVETRGIQKATSGNVTKSFFPFGNAFHYHYGRNILAMSGLRVLQGPLDNFLSNSFPSMNEGPRLAIATLTGTAFSHAISTPLHSIYAYKAANPLNKESALKVLKKLYKTENGDIRFTAIRDVKLRIIFGTSLWTLFGYLEKNSLNCVNRWEQRRKYYESPSPELI